MAEYTPAEIEPRWQAFWEENETFRTEDDFTRPKYYALDMFPYPSGAGLHVGHPEGYTATDIVSRYKRMCGFNVLHPMGWDAFGLPAERAALRENVHPATLTREYIDNFRRQIKRLGFSYDWRREINTTDPAYYKWTQWIFLKLYERGLAYQAEVPVNWCPAQGTVLANEEVQDGVYVETGDPVVRKNLRQWQLKIPVYAERLLADLEDLDWPEQIKEMQRHWIGRSEGAEIAFGVEGSAQEIRVFTTRPDTLFGATYMVLAPEHALVAELTSEQQRDAVAAYITSASMKSDLQRTDLAKEKSGVFIGAYATHPVTGARVPIWISDYVLASYGTGAIMAVPAHDTRDWEFARQFNLPIVEVIQGGDVATEAFCGNGTLINSDFLNGLNVDEAKERMTAWLEAEGRGTGTVSYKLRDWLFSRQRYWGEPFPILHLDDGTVTTVPIADLPVELPHVDAFKPTEDGEPPLARAEDWVATVDPRTGAPARRETNTMPQWAGSCWYYLRYIDPHNTEALVDPEKEKYWMPVDLYVGGAEHAVLHLLYARFWHKVLFDAGVVSTPEPFRKLFNQGMILAFSYKDAGGKYYHPDAIETVDGTSVVAATKAPVSKQIEKMAKSKLNVANPDDVIDEFGADALRLYEMYMGPLEQTKPWQTDGVRGMYRFLARTYRLMTNDDGALSSKIADGDASPEVNTLVHQTIKRVTDDIEGMRFNTAIASLIELVNALYKAPNVTRDTAKTLILLLSPFAPHLAEELWRTLGATTSVAHETWPKADPALLVATTMTIAVQVNGKTRGTVEVEVGASETDVVGAAHALERVAAALDGRDPMKTIYIPKKIVNFIVRS